MLQVCVKQLLSAIQSAEAFTLPEMDTGTAYLYNNLYGKLAQGEDVGLSNLDMTAFDTDDIASLKELYTEVFEANSHAASGLTMTLRHMNPICKIVNYV